MVLFCVHYHQLHFGFASPLFIRTLLVVGAENYFASNEEVRRFLKYLNKGARDAGGKTGNMEQ